MKDINAIYNTCCTLIRQVENSKIQNLEIDQNLLNIIRTSFNDVLSFERVYLIRCEDKLYGSILLNMEFEINFEQDGAMDLDVSKDPYILKVNPLWCGDFTLSEFTGLIVQEIIKLIYAHPASYADINPTNRESVHDLLELASDAASSSIVKKDIRFDSLGYREFQ